MYLRTVKTRGPGNTVYEYLRLVESYRENGKNKQRTLANLGRRDLLAPHADSLLRLLTGEEASPSEIEAVGAWDWGPVLALRTIWQELGLEAILDRLDSSRSGEAPSLAERSFVLVANRLIAPGSEHGLANWLETDYVCDRQGRRWVPHWREEEERQHSASPRVRVAPRQLQRWYRTLDQLHQHQSQIEVELYQRLRDLFSLEIDLAFYDLTSTYFQGHGPEPLAAHGYSRDGKPRQRQVLVGVVMVQGWPLAHHVFRGNLRDSATLPPVLEDLQRRFPIRRVVMVGDRGMVTGENLQLLRAEAHGYVVGLNRRRNAPVADYLARATGAWQECPVGLTASERAQPPRTRVQEVAGDEPGVRIFVVESEERLAYEQAEREKSMARVRARLDKLQKRIEAGRLKAPEKVGAAAARALAKNHGTRYYDWEYRDGQFRYFEHPVQSVTFLAGCTLRRQVCDPDRGEGAQPRRSRRNLQRTQRSRTRLPQLEGRARAETDLSPNRPSSGGSHLCRRSGLLAPEGCGAQTQGRSTRPLTRPGASGTAHRQSRGSRSRPRQKEALCDPRLWPLRGHSQGP